MSEKAPEFMEVETIPAVIYIPIDATKLTIDSEGFFNGRHVVLRKILNAEEIMDAKIEAAVNYTSGEYTYTPEDGELILEDSQDRHI